MEKEKVPVSVITLVVGIAIAIVSFWYGQNNGLLPEQASEQAPLVDGFFNIMVTIATGLFFVVQGTIVFCAIVFRQRKGDDADGPPIEGNVPLEIFWTAIPTLIVLGLGVYSVQVYREMGGFEPAGAMVAHHHDATSHQTEMAAKIHSGAAIAAPLIADSEGMEPTEAAAPAKKSRYGFGATPEELGKLPYLTVGVTGIQYAWLFNYPGGIVAGELHVPIGEDVLLNISAQDVIHSFWVPQFRLKQDAIPGKDTQLRFVATKVGEYPVYCAELCGAYHGAMRTQVIVHTEEDYESWLAENAIAQQQENATQTVALNVAELSESEYLTPYAKEIGIDSKTLSQID